MPGVVISYVDGEVEEGLAVDWPKMRAEGVDEVLVDNRLAQGMSLYWLYPEDESWVVGEAAVRYSPNPLTEVVISPEGQTERELSYFPDLPHSAVKLGWWRPGEERPRG